MQSRTARANTASLLALRPERRVLVRSHVPSQQHEILVEMFRNRPELACELLERVVGLRTEPGTVEIASNDLSQAFSVEYRADAVTLVRGKDGAPVLAVIVEVQNRVDRDKRLTWPLYIAALRARLGCRVVLLVITPDDAVARWARRSIDTGHPGFVLEPVVIGFSDLPRVIDRDLVRRAPELGVLSVMAHRDLEAALVVAPEILEQPERMRQVYLDLIYSALPAAAASALKELLMEKYEYQSSIVREYVAQGRAEGLEEGRQEGREEGREEGLRSAVLAFARAKLGDLPAAYEAAVRDLHAERDLTALIAELGRCEHPADVHAVLTRLVGRS